MDIRKQVDGSRGSRTDPVSPSTNEVIEVGGIWDVSALEHIASDTHSSVIPSCAAPCLAPTRSRRDL